MIDLEFIRSFFPPAISKESRFDRYMLKEIQKIRDTKDTKATLTY